jgi:hypothetical protein
LITIAWGACYFITEGLCLPLVGVFGGFVGLKNNKNNDAKIQDTIIEGLRRDVEDIQSDLKGKFRIGQAIYGQP